MFGAKVSVMSQCSAQTAAPTAAGLIAALLLVDVWTDVAMARSKHSAQKHLTLGCVEYYKTHKPTRNLTHPHSSFDKIDCLQLTLEQFIIQTRKQ